MKKLLTLLICAIFGISAYAQKIEYDKLNDDGFRLIGTTLENVGSMTDRIKAKLSLGAIVSPDGKSEYILDVFLTTGQAISAPAGARMLIKTKNGEVITLQERQGKSLEDMIGKKRLIPELQNMVVTEYSIQLMYALTTEQIQQMSSGVVKIRIELDGGSNYDKEWKKDKVGKILSKDFELVNNALSKDNRKSFTDGF